VIKIKEALIFGTAMVLLTMAIMLFCAWYAGAIL
jgi:hypothetical protein